MEGVITESETPLPSSVLLSAMRLRSGMADDICDTDHARLSENIRYVGIPCQSGDKMCNVRRFSD